jgi:photosystem II stability/assembly factor-like uncharacterized protein
MKKTFTLIALSLFSIGANAQWDTLNTQTLTDFNSIAFTDNWNGMAVGKNPATGDGAAFWTGNAGLTWGAANLSTNSHAMNDIGFFPASHFGYAVGDSGQIFMCNTNVMTISPPEQLGTDDLNCIFPANDSVAYIGGDNGALYRTSDNGTSWDTLDIQSTQPVRDIFFSITALEGWIVCDGGYIAHTLDGGQTWTAQLQYYGGFLQCKGIAFTETTMNGFIVGNSGMMVSSINAGLSWDTFPPITNLNLSCIRFTNSLAGIICGDSGRIYRTYAGGFNWVNESMSYVTEKLNKICFSSDSIAYICGENGRIVKSNTDISSVEAPINFAMHATAYPNPFESEFHLVVNLEKASAVQIAVMDLSGRIVLNENSGELNAGTTVLTPQGISTLSSGMYVVQITTAYGTVTLPVVRQ